MIIEEKAKSIRLVFVLSFKLEKLQRKLQKSETIYKARQGSLENDDVTGKPRAVFVSCILLAFISTVAHALHGLSNSHAKMSQN